MKFNIKHVIEGITNSVFVKDEVEALANARHEICKVCPKNSIVIKEARKDPNAVLESGPYYSEIRPDEHCSMCACNIHAKVRSLHTACPINKWEVVADKEEAAKVAAALDGIH